MSALTGEDAAACQLVGLIRPKALYEGVADSIRERVLAHQLPPGSPIDEVALARHYGVSRTPVREAIKVLVNEGLLNMTPYRGCHVAEVGREELLELLDVIGLLDGHALRHLVMQPEKARLSGLFAAYEHAAAAPGKNGAVWITFCAQVREALGNTPFTAVSRNLHQQLRLCLGPLLDQADIGAPPEVRAGLLQAMLDGDADALGLSCHRHAALLRIALLTAFDRQAQAGRLSVLSA